MDENIVYVKVATLFSQKGKKAPNQVVLYQLSVAARACALHSVIWGFWPGGTLATGSSSPALGAPLELAAGLPRQRHGRRVVVVSLACGGSRTLSRRRALAMPLCRFLSAKCVKQRLWCQQKGAQDNSYQRQAGSRFSSSCAKSSRSDKELAFFFHTMALMQ